MHLQIAKAIEQLYRERLEDYYEALAHHFELGEDWQKAAEYYGKAGSKAREVHADEGAEAFLEKREQAVQKVFEQKEGKSRIRQRRIAGFIFLIAYPLWLLFSDPDSLLDSLSTGPGWAAVGLVFLGLYLLIKELRSPSADAMTIYADRFVIRSRKGLLQIPFASITSVQWRVKIRRELFGDFRKERTVYGTSRFWTEAENFYFSRPNRLEILCRNHHPLSIHSLHAKNLYRELKLSMMKWGATQQIDLTGIFEGSPSRFEEHHQLLLRQADGFPLPPVTYDQLLERIERAEVEGKDEIALRGEPEEEKVWISLKQASREDRRLWAALHPLSYSLKFPLYQLALIISFGTGGVIAGMAVSGQMDFLSGLLITSAFALPLFLLRLRFGFLEWSKRLKLSQAQRLGLRVLTGIAIPAAIVGLIWLEESLPVPRLLSSPSTVTATAPALPLAGIQIDGHLDDWPAGTEHHPIRSNGQAYGPTDLDDKDLSAHLEINVATHTGSHADQERRVDSLNSSRGLTTSPDLSPHFMAGYDPTENLLYLAVQVRDDSLVVGGSDHLHTDACEVYVDGDHSGEAVSFLRQIWGSAAGLAALQYVAIPGEGNYGPGHKGNPSLLWGDIGQTRTQMAYSRQGDTTTYEWAVQAFDHYPNVPTQLAPGKIIGFDVVVVDKDSQDDNPAWISWAPYAPRKFLNADLLGDLVLVEQPVKAE